MDDHLRQLERRFQESGDPEDEARWLRERLRAGALSEARLQLAAHLGHPAAIAVLGKRPVALTHRALEGVRKAKCGIYRCERYHAVSTGELRHGRPLGWSGVLRCADLSPAGEPQHFQRSSPDMDARCLRALEDWLGGPREGLGARTPAAELIELALAVSCR